MSVGGGANEVEQVAASLGRLAQVHSGLVGIIPLRGCTPATWIRIVPRHLGYAVPADAGRRAEAPERARILSGIYGELRSLVTLNCAFAGFEISGDADDPDAFDTVDWGVATLPAEALAGAGAVIPRSWLAHVEAPQRFVPFHEGLVWDPRLSTLGSLT